MTIFSQVQSCMITESHCHKAQGSNEIAEHHNVYTGNKVND